MKACWLLCLLLIGIVSANGEEAPQQEDANVQKVDASKTSQPLNVTTTAVSLTTAASSTVTSNDEPEVGKDKRQIGGKETQVYANHRSDTNVAETADENDDPESPQETVYGPKPTQQFLIRPISAQQQQQQHQQLQHQQQHLRNYPATIRPHGTQLLEQSQEIQHFAYLQEISRNQPKALNAAQFQGKPSKKTARLLASPPSPVSSQQQQQQYSGEEAEQRYAIAVRNPYHLAALQQQQQQQQQHQHQHQHQQQQPQEPQPPYQIIPEEQFLKLLEEELQARAYEAQYRQQQQQQQQQHHHQHQQQQNVQQQQQRQQQQEQQQLQEEQAADAAAAAATKPPPPPPLPPHLRQGALGLGSYRQSVTADEPPQQLVQYVPRHRGGPKYLPLPQAPPPHHLQAQALQQQQQHQQQQQQAQYLDADPELQQQQIPPQIAYYQPQITSYKALPNHPLAKSSLEKEIEKLLATNKPSVAAVHIVDSNNEPSAVVNQHHQPPPPQPRYTRPPIGVGDTKVQQFVAASTTPNSLLDANNQPFVPSLFRFSSYQPPTPIYPTQLPQNLVAAKKLGPVVYPTQPTNGVQPTQPTQYYYQDSAPTAGAPKPKAFRAKQYGNKIPNTGSSKPREKSAIKYAQQQQQLVYEFDPQPQDGQFYPSPPDPIRASKAAQSSLAPTAPAPPPADFRQYVLPSPAPSQSSIYVSQGTGIATQSRPLTHRTQQKGAAKTVDDVKQLHLPQPGGKPLTQAEFQALVEAGYPVTAVPVPVPVPYEQFFKDHPEYRNQRAPVDYAQLMRFGPTALPAPHSQPQQRSLAVASEPSVKIISTPGDGQTASAIGGGSVTYLRPIHGGSEKRRTRDEKETEVAGKTEAVQ